MRILVAEDDFASRKFISKFLAKFGDVDITADGAEAVEAFRYAVEDCEYYNLVCLDVMMPNMNGLEALQNIREIESEFGVPKQKKARIIMTTALNDVAQVNAAFEYGCEGYAAKPIDTEAFETVLRKMKLIED